MLFNAWTRENAEMSSSVSTMFKIESWVIAGSIGCMSVTPKFPKSIVVRAVATQRICETSAKVGHADVGIHLTISVVSDAKHWGLDHGGSAQNRSRWTRAGNWFGRKDGIAVRSRLSRVDGLYGLHIMVNDTKLEDSVQRRAVIIARIADDDPVSTSNELHLLLVAAAADIAVVRAIVLEGEVMALYMGLDPFTTAGYFWYVV